MSGVGQIEQKFRPPRRNNAITMKKEETRLQSLLNFIDTRMQEQRTKLRRQMEDTQQSAEEMEEKRHKATLQVLKNYFEVTSGRIRASSQLNHIHEERMTGVLSEPSLATVPEVDPEILAKPRSMYDRITRNLDTSKLPLIANKKNSMTTQSAALPTKMPSSNRSDDSSTPRVIISPQVTPSSTPRHPSTPSDSTDDGQWNEPKKPFPIKKDERIQSKLLNARFAPNELSVQRGIQSPSGRALQYRNKHRFENGEVSPPRYGKRNEHDMSTDNYDHLNGHVYQKGSLKPTSTLTMTFEDSEPPTPRLGDLVASKKGLTRHISLKKNMKSNMSVSTVSMSDLQPTRKQQAASKLRHALKSTSFRIQR